MVDQPEEPAKPSGGRRMPEPADETVALPPTTADETTVVPPAARSVPWSGRAEVPVGRSGTPRYDGPTEWSEAGEPASGRWYLPIVIGLVALLLLGLLGLGLWLLNENDADEPSGPAVPSVSPSATATPGRSVPPSSVPATTRPPTPTATATPTAVPLPPLVGLPLESARRVLDQLGVAYRLEFRESDQPGGTIIDTDPRVGEPVARGDQVTLVVAEGRVAPPTTATPAPTGSGG